jgi:hypothetical protein
VQLPLKLPFCLPRSLRSRSPHRRMVSEVRSLALLIVATPNSHLPYALRAALFTFGATMHPQQPPWLLSTSHNNTPSSPLNQRISQMFCESPVRLWAHALDLARQIYPPTLYEPPAQWPCFAPKSTQISSAFSADGAPTKCSAISPSKPYLLCEIFLPECSTTDPSRCIPTKMFPCFSFHPRSSPPCSHPSLMAPRLPVTFREWMSQPLVSRWRLGGLLVNRPFTTNTSRAYEDYYSKRR